MEAIRTLKNPRTRRKKYLIERFTSPSPKIDVIQKKENGRNHDHK